MTNPLDSDDIEIVRAEGKRRPRLEIDDAGFATLCFDPPFELQGRFSGILVHCQVDSRAVDGNARTKWDAARYRTAHSWLDLVPAELHDQIKSHWRAKGINR